MKSVFLYRNAILIASLKESYQIPIVWSGGTSRVNKSGPGETLEWIHELGGFRGRFIDRTLDPVQKSFNIDLVSSLIL